MSSKVVLILGAGSNIGKALVQKFSSNGFKVAIAARTLHKEVTDSSDFSVKNDFTDPTTIASIFASVKSELGAPSVVIYNG